MFKHYVKIAFRNIQRQRAFSFINILGLSIGIACTVLIFLWVMDELSYDRFHENSDTLYRVLAEWKQQEAWSARTPGLLAPACKEEIPEIVDAARILQDSRKPTRHGERAFYEDRIANVDPSFFEMFSFPFRKGDPKRALNDALSIVITEEMACKYFGDDDPIGKALNANNWTTYTVSGVLDEIRENSSIHFDFFSSHAVSEKYWKSGYNWTNYQHETYVQLREGVPAALIAEKITGLIFRHDPRVRSYLRKVHLQPLTSIHLDAGIARSTVIIGNRKYIYIFSAIAVLVLLIACINFMNLSTARSMQRAKEVGVRKVVGADRQDLIKQFFGESLLFALISLLMAMLLVELSLPIFNQLSGKQLMVSFADKRLLLGLLSTMLLTGLTAGSYPALYLSSFRPANVLRGTLLTFLFARIGVARKLRSVLVVSQFALSIVLIIGALVVYNQLDYMRNRPLGFDKDNIISIPAKGQIGANYEAVKNELLRDADIIGVAAQQSSPLVTQTEGHADWPGKRSDQNIFFEQSAVSFDFVQTIGLRINQGRNFSPEFATDDEDAFLINEAAARVMEMESPVGKKITIAGEGIRTGTIVGVVEDAHFKSFHHKINPQIFYVLNDLNSPQMDLYGVLLVKIRGGDISKTLEAIEGVWKKFNRDIPFEYHFLDQIIDRQYDAEKRISQFVNYFTFLAIFISCIGLFGLAAFMSEQRTKEIGIRKVLGLSVFGVVRLLSKEFTKWLILANIVAWPVALVVMNKWLQDFAYHIDMNWWIFFLAGASTLVVAFLTVGYQAVKVALTNPVEALRYE